MDFEPSSKMELEIDGVELIIEDRYIYRSMAMTPGFTFDEVESGDITSLVSQFNHAEPEIIREFETYRDVFQKGIIKYNKLIAFL